MVTAGSGLLRSDELAKDMFAGAADQGLAAASYKLAQCYRDGWGVPADEDIAQQLFAVAANGEEFWADG